MADIDEPRHTKRNLLLSTALLAVPLFAGVAIINDALPTGQANAAAVAVTDNPAAAAVPAARPPSVDVAELTTDVPRRGPSPNALIDATFAALPDEERGASVAADRAADAKPMPSVDVAEIEDDVVEPPPDGVTAVRKVRTTPIKVVPTENGLSAVPAPLAVPAPPSPAAADAVADAPATAEPERQTMAVAALDTPVVTPEPVAREPEAMPAPRVERPVAKTVDAPEPQAEAKGGKGVHIGRQAVNARSGPSKSAGKVFVVDAGESVKAVETSKGWVRIIDADGRSGWVYSDFLVGANVKALPVGETKVAPSRQKAAANADDPKSDGVAVADVGDDVAPVPASGTFTSTEAINVRAKPNKAGGRLFVLNPGEQVTVTATAGGWSQVETADGRRGWVYANVK